VELETLASAIVGERLHRRGCAFAFAALVSGTGAAACVQPTPFDTQPSEVELTAKDLARIEARRAEIPSFKFVAIGDTHDDYSALNDAVGAINQRDDVAFVIDLGDQTDQGLLREFELTRDELSDLEVPYLTVIGNHDALSNGAEVYRRMYGALDYSFVFGGVKLIVFNSNSLEFPGQAPDREWLEAQLSDLEGASSAIWITHQEIPRPDEPPGADSKQFYARLLDDYPVTSLVLHGHRIERRLRRYHDTPVLQSGTFQVVFTYNIVTVTDGRATDVELCDLDGCAAPVPLP
jgi:3',5'-cyclic-AMP phosphodiesterase